MVDLIAEKSFARVLDDVRDQIGDERFDLWFGNCKLKSLFRGTLKIGVPNVFFQDWIQTHYGTALHYAVERVLGISMRIEVEVDSALNQDLQERIQDDSLSELLKEEEGDKGHRTLGDFVRTPENETAYRAVRHLVDNEAFGFNPLVIVGPEGVGKSHLASCFRAYRGGLDPESPRVLETDALRFTKSFTLSLKTKRMAEFRARFENLDVVVFDEVHRLKGKKATQQEFLHLLRRLVQQQVQVVLVGRHHPREIHDITDAFKSNLMSGMMVNIESYNAGSLRKILLSNLAQAQDGTRAGVLRDAAGSEVIKSLARHSSGSVRELTAQLRRAHVLAFMRGERLSAAFVNQHLDEFGVDSSERQDVDRLLGMVCSGFSVLREDLTSKRKTKCHALPRAVAAFALRDYLGMTYKEVGHQLGGRSHTSIYMMIKKYRSQIEQDSEIRSILERLAASCGRGTGRSE